MGKPYQNELSVLPNTYARAMALEIKPLLAAIAASAQKSLVAVGSGGSLSAAEFTASLHQHYACRLARAATPLEMINAGNRHFDSSFLLFSAGGANKDILSVFRHLARLEPHRLAVLTAKTGTPIGKLADQFQFVDKIEFSLPNKKDGFLATNSLIAFSVLAARAYGTVFKASEMPPKTFGELLHPNSTFVQFCSILKTQCARLWERNNLVILYSPSLLSAARDLESKFTEAALNPVQIADFRHFAHGRHHWLAKQGASTSVLALVGQEDADLATRTMVLLPKEIPQTQLNFDGGPICSQLKALCTGLFIAGFAGQVRGIDPGRPGVPPFGRKIYHLGPGGKRQQPRSDQVLLRVARKLGVTNSEMPSDRLFKTWSAYHKAFVQKLDAQTFHGLVLDYDGTICDDRHRFDGPHREIIKPILNLLAHGVPVGIATGRGDSARRDLRKCIPSRLWPRVLVGYQNGSQIGRLSDDSCPKAVEATGLKNDLHSLLATLTSDDRLLELAKVVGSGFQISIRPHPLTSVEFVCSLVQELISKTGNAKVQLVRSGHSIDVLPEGVSKLQVVAALRKAHNLKDEAAVLCIGDRGRWPGNDYELLSTPNSLSVDEVSTDPATCWNLAAAGHRGSQATLDYLNAIKLSGTKFRVRSGKIGGDAHEG
jgi:hypothetical protein